VQVPPKLVQTCSLSDDNYRKIKLLAEAAEYRLDNVALYRSMYTITVSQLK